MEPETALSSYHIFNAVAEAGNLSKAARTLYISQPAISRAVSRLEQSLSVKLFIRGSRGVCLTEEGKMLYEHTKTAFDSLRQGEETLRRFSTLGNGTLSIGASPALCKYILTPYLQQFIQEYPHIQITIRCHSTKEILELLEQNRLDIGLVTDFGSLHQLEFLPVTKSEPIFVASRDYLKNLDFTEESAAFQIHRPATKKASGAIPPYFKAATLMLPENDHSFRSYIENYLDRHTIEAARILEVSSMDLLIDFAKISLGIGCVIKEFVQKELVEQTLTELPLPTSPGICQIGFAYQKTRLQSGSVNKFIEFYKGGTR